MDELEIVSQLLGNESKESQKLITKSFQQLKYITEEEFIKLGRPKFGYTIARIGQFEKHSPAWYKVFVEYLVIAIKYSKLYWYLEAYDWVGDIDKKIKDTLLEIEEFRKQNSINYHDFRWVEQLAYEEEYSRNNLIARIKKINSSTKIPPKERPIFKYIKWPTTPQIPQQEEQTLDVIINELFDKPAKQAAGCPQHPEFRGLRLRKTNTCQGCINFYNQNLKSGIRETRNV